MRKGKIIGIVAAVIVLLGGVGYWIYDNVTGNHIEIESLISPESGLVTPASAETMSPAPADSPSASVGPSTASSATPGDSAAPAAAALEGTWVVQDSSKVYFSVTTSRETVNYQIDEVTGSWTINSADPGRSTAEGTAQLSSMDSGSDQRDTHVKSADYLDVAAHPQATFTTTGFEGLPADLAAQIVYPLKIKGELMVKGITKEVEFSGNTVLDNGVLKLEASTVVTFADYGMENPHNVVMDTENNITVELRLTLAQS